MSYKEIYTDTVVNKLKKELNCSSNMAVPRLEKIVVNCGIGKHRDNKTYVQEAIDDISAISGQMVSRRNAKVSVANFKIREGNLVGLCTTLRRDRMWYFYDKLVNIALPRKKDFSGLSKKSFDGTGNYNLGLDDYSIFPEIDANKITFLKPMQLTICTTSRNEDMSYLLLKELGFPFKD